MLRLFVAVVMSARSAFKARRDLALENLALRQQLAVLRHQVTRARPTRTDRAFWVMLSRLWDRWTDSLVFVKPETVIRWHRKGFALFWTWKSRRRDGRPRVRREVIDLIRRMARENSTWGAPRIHGELMKLGFDVSEATVSRYMPR
ncbi:MAG: IS3 family transposase [Sandaracinaceae bacterium]